MERPIFVVGTMRSGSTLLRLMLDSHPRLAIGEESGFMRAVAATRNIPGHDSGARWYRRFGITDEEMDERLRRFYDEIFSSFAAAQGKQRWGDKTPFHANQIRRIAELFPDAVFVGIVRHPAAVVASQMRRGTPFDTALRSWVHVNTRLLGAATSRTLRGRTAIVRYEDLVTAPEPTLRALLRFLGEPWSGDVLRHHEVQREKRGAGRLAEGGTRTDQAVDPARSTRWLSELDAEQRTRVTAASGPLRRVLGYDERGARPLRSRDRPRRLLRGRFLARRYRGVGRVALVAARTVLPPPAPAREARDDGAGRLVRMLRTDARYTLARLPAVALARRRERRRDEEG